MIEKVYEQLLGIPTNKPGNHNRQSKEVHGKSKVAEAIACVA